MHCTQCVPYIGHVLKRVLADHEVEDLLTREFHNVLYNKLNAGCQFVMALLQVARTPLDEIHAEVEANDRCASASQLD